MKTQIDSASKQKLIYEFFEPRKIENYYFFTNNFSRVDCIFTFNNKDWYCELKVRRCLSTTYKDTMIEKSKYDYLLENDGVYIAFFDDCYYLWQIKGCKVEFGSKVCPKTTDFNNNEYVRKEVAYINFSDGTKFEYNNKNVN